MGRIRSVSTLVTHIPPTILSVAPIACMIGLIALGCSHLALFCVLVACLLLGLAAMKTNRAEWTRLIRSGKLGTGRVQFIDRPDIGVSLLLINLLSWLVFGLVFGLLLTGRLNLTAFQWFLIVAGVGCWELFCRLFWLPIEYMVTNQGIWIQYNVFRKFIPFDNLREVKFVPGRLSPRGYYAPPAYTRYSNFVILIPTNPAKIGKTIRTILLTPRDIAQFLQHLPNDLLSKMNDL